MNTPQPEDNLQRKLPSRQVIRLDDLDWEDETIGGASGKLYFGEGADTASSTSISFGLNGLDRHRPK